LLLFCGIFLDLSRKNAHMYELNQSTITVDSTHQSIAFFGYSAGIMVSDKIYEQVSLEAGQNIPLNASHLGGYWIVSTNYRRQGYSFGCSLWTSRSRYSRI